MTKNVWKFLVEGDGGRKTTTVTLYARLGVEPFRLNGIAKKKAAVEMGLAASELNVTAHESAGTVEMEATSKAPQRPVVRKLKGIVPHGVNPDIIVTIYPRGLIGLRENRRAQSSEVTFDVGELYVMGLFARIRAEKRAKAIERKAKKKGKR